MNSTASSSAPAGSSGPTAISTHAVARRPSVPCAVCGCCRAGFPAGGRRGGSGERFAIDLMERCRNATDERDQRESWLRRWPRRLHPADQVLLRIRQFGACFGGVVAVGSAPKWYVARLLGDGRGNGVKHNCKLCDKPEAFCKCWPCACVKRGRDGTLKAIKLHPKETKKCRVCGSPRPETE